MLTTFKLFIRNFKRNRLFSLVNILGLTTGFFTSILIYLYVQGELSYDQFHENGDRIYRVNQTFIWGDDNPNQFSSTGPGVGYSIAEEVPEVEQVVRIHTPDMLPITFDQAGKEKFFNEEEIFAVDSNFLKVFSFPLLHGDRETALLEPRSVVLTHETAIKFFGETNVVGTLLTMDNGETFKVTGVLEKMTDNSYLDEFDLLVSMSSIPRVAHSGWNWIWTMFETFILIREDAAFENVREKIAALPQTHAEESLKAMGYTYDEYIGSGKEWNLFLHPLTKINLHSTNVINRLSGTGDLKIVLALIGSVVFLLVLSCINFINLSTAQFTSKAKDVALRKVLGGTKGAFIRRFFGESLAYCIISFILAFFLLFNSIPLINQSLDISLSFASTNQMLLVGFVLGLILVTSLASGFYPFVFFNGFKPVSAMKGEFKTGGKGVRLRNGMLVVQYSLSLILLLGTFTIYSQLEYILNKDVGFEKENVMMVHNVDWTGAQEEFANEVANIPGVKLTSVTDSSPMFVSNGDQFIPDEPGAGAVPLNYSVSDEKYIELLEIDLVLGRFFDESFASDSLAVLINERAARMIGWEIDETILNKKVTREGQKFHVIGVLRDFNFWSLHAPIEPFAMFDARSGLNYGPLSRVLVRIEASQEEKDNVIAAIESKWNEFLPNRPFEYLMLTERFEEQYKTEAKFGGVLGFFSVLTIIIASLGLFGIVVFSIEQKLKEIGVRKVLGASLNSLIILFSSGYVKLLLIAFVIASPVGYFFMENWLSDFEYRIPMNPLMFILSFSILLVISLGIAFYNTTRASLMNPAEVLKDE